MKLLTVSLVLAFFVAACSSSGTSGSSGTSASSGAAGGGQGGSGSGQGGSMASGGGQGGVMGAGGGLPAGACRSGKDCMNGEFCSLDDLPPFCGGQCDNNFNADCQVDAECANAGANFICDIPCRCQHGGAVPTIHCTVGCSANADCGPSKVCSATHRCDAAACVGANDCSANFSCEGAAGSKQCAPKACAADADCGDYCVNGACATVLGQCRPAVP